MLMSFETICPSPAPGDLITGSHKYIGKFHNCPLSLICGAQALTVLAYRSEAGTEPDFNKKWWQRSHSNSPPRVPFD